MIETEVEAIMTLANLHAHIERLSLIITNPKTPENIRERAKSAMAQAVEFVGRADKINEES